MDPWTVITLSLIHILPDGKLTVCENESDRIPLFIRKFLEPNAANDLTITSLPKVDRLLSDFKTEITEWETYWRACEQLFKKATGKTFRTMNYHDHPEIIIIKASERNMAQPIICLLYTSYPNRKPPIAEIKAIRNR